MYDKLVEEAIFGNKLVDLEYEMAICLSKGFGGSAESWLIHQTRYDLWQDLKNENTIKVTAFS